MTGAGRGARPAGAAAVTAVAVAAVAGLLACGAPEPATGPAPPSGPGARGGPRASAGAPPTVLFAVSPRWPRPGDTITVDGSFSHDGDGQVVTYVWALGPSVTQTTGAVARTVVREAGTYAVHLTATDDSGNVATASLALVVGPAGPPVGAVDPAQSTIALSATAAAAGTPVTATVTARDALGAPVAGVPVRLSAAGQAVSVAQPAATGADGVTAGTVAAGRAQTLAVRAVADFVALAGAPALTVSAAGVSATQSRARLTDPVLAAGGDSSLLEVTARDAQGNPVAGAAVSVSAAGGGVTVANEGPTDAHGRRVVTVRSLACGVARTLTATVDGVTLADQPSVRQDAVAAYGACAPALWLDASDSATLTVEAGGRVTEWRDRSGAGVHLSAAPGAVARPTVLPAAMNGLATVAFDPALGQYLTAPAGVDARTILAVHRATQEGPADRTILSVRTTVRGATCAECEAFYFKSLNTYRGEPAMYLISTAGDYAAWQGTAFATPTLLSSVTADATFDLRRDLGSTWVASYAGALLPRTGPTTVGAAWYDGALGDFFAGEIAELVVFDRPLTPGERDTAERALMTKWGIPTP